MDKGFYRSIQEFAIEIEKNFKGEFHVDAMLVFQQRGVTDMEWSGGVELHRHN